MVIKKGDSMFNKVVPLSAGFMLTSILGILVSVFFFIPSQIEQLSTGDYVCKSMLLCSLGVAFTMFFVIMFISSVISMTYAPLDAEFDIRNERKSKD